MVIRFSRSLLRCTSISARNGARNRAIPRSFGNAARNSDESLKAEFKHWLKKEVVLLSVMVLAGATGVHFYQNRKNAPVKQVERLLKQAEESAIEGDRKQALKHCLCAYDVIKSTNPNDRHLFELAFAIAAQYENLGRGTPATSYYLDALEHNSRELNVAKRERNQVVTLDRIAQAYENRGQIKTAERYFQQAVSLYDQSQGRRELSKVQQSEAADFAALGREMPGVLYNFSHLLMAEKRWNEAGKALSRAKTIARNSSLSDEHVKLIERAIDSVELAKTMDKGEVEGDKEQS